MRFLDEREEDLRMRLEPARHGRRPAPRRADDEHEPVDIFDTRHRARPTACGDGVRQPVRVAANGRTAKRSDVSRFSFSIAATDGAARTGVIAMQRGEIRTPAFMPVGTAATVKAMRPEEVRASGADIILGNTYHLMLRPGAERVAKLGGLHRFMGWERPILTDSGGYQVMSLSELTKVTEEGVAFASHLDGSRHMLSPERSIEVQRLLDSDIVMQFDQLVPTTSTEQAQREAMERSIRWATAQPRGVRPRRRACGARGDLRHPAGRARRGAAAGLRPRR